MDVLHEKNEADVEKASISIQEHADLSDTRARATLEQEIK